MKIKSLLMMAVSFSALAAHADSIPEQLKTKEALKSKMKIDSFGQFDILKYGAQILADSAGYSELKLQNFHVVPSAYSSREKRSLTKNFEVVDNLLVVPFEVDFRYTYDNLRFKGDWIKEKTGYDLGFNVKLSNGTLTYSGNLLITLKANYIESIEVLENPKDSQIAEKGARLLGNIKPNDPSMLNAVRLSLETKFLTDLKLGQEIVDRSIERIRLLEAADAGLQADVAADLEALKELQAKPEIPAAK